MLFNIVLVPMAIFMVTIISEIKNNLTKFNFVPKKMIEKVEDLLSEEDVISYNKKYMLPMCYILMGIMITMSIATIIFERDIYHIFIMFGFFGWFLNLAIFWILGTIDLNKKIR
ncbi:hypothetical protein CACET_c08210 [Clostridium aceticum]|uniref:Uncharacterized protein n=2 Tax=Clostridium aceticum TaxID=84022 RepID=A0A0D8IAB6_9CLOT|nr:hypothetical protein [Clostridium aceticum]AKL94330.1 hypothetical protein CACET_c08210 [Clostridium aceticum]KJF26171.1 hypothetical protein TZ02_15110 [Clostridium aceticum]